jgi:hypothetical protein
MLRTHRRGVEEARTAIELAASRGYALTLTNLEQAGTLAAELTDEAHARGVEIQELATPTGAIDLRICRLTDSGALDGSS